MDWEKESSRRVPDEKANAARELELELEGARVVLDRAEDGIVQAGEMMVFAWGDPPSVLGPASLEQLSRCQEKLTVAVRHALSVRGEYYRIMKALHDLESSDAA